MEILESCTALKINDELHKLEYIPGEGLIIPMVYVDYITGYYDPKPHYSTYNFLIPDSILRQIKAALEFCEGDDKK